MSDHHKFYSYFNLSPTATREEIILSYRKLSKYLHPDKQSPAHQDSAKSFFSKLSYYKEVLTNETTRFVYDRFGKQGALLALKRKNITSFELKSVEDQLALQKQMEYLLLKAYYDDVQKELVHQRSWVFNLSIAEYLEHGDKFKLIKLKEKVLMNSVVLNEMIRVNFTQKIIADFGFIYQCTETESLSALTTKLVHRFDSGIVAQCSYQIGNNFSSTYSVNKNIGNTQVFLQNHFANKVITPSATLMRYIFKDTLLRIDLTGGENKSASVSLSRPINERLKNNLKVHQQDESLEVSSDFTLEVREGFKAKIGINVKSSVKNHTHYIVINPNLWFTSKLGKLISLSFGVEADSKGISLSTILKKGAFSLYVPLKVTNSISVKRFLVCTSFSFVLGLGAYFLSKSLKALSGAFSKNNKERLKELEKYQEHDNIVSEIQILAQTAARSENLKNGLVILKALYGDVSRSKVPSFENKVLDIQPILQIQIKDSRLFLHPNTLNTLSGVFEPCSNAFLYVLFRFGSLTSERIYKANDPIILP